jgi:hypothetical protein
MCLKLPPGDLTMTVEQLRKLHQARPFQPFTIHLADGGQLQVTHNEFLSHSPTGRTIIVHHGEEDFSVIDLLLMTRLQVHAATPSDGQAA